MSQFAKRETGRVVSVMLTTGGSGYTAPPAVSLSGGGGTGAQAVAHMSGTMVESVVITNAGSGYTSDPAVTIAGNAQASARAYTGSFRPATFYRSRFNDLYAVDGMGRGLRWNGADGQFQPIGILKPSRGPTVTASTGPGGQYVTAINVVRGGAGYTTAPTVTLSGGTPDRAAKAVATISGGRVTQIEVTDTGKGYQAAPVVSISGGEAGGASLLVSVIGSVAEVSVTNQGSGFTSSGTNAPNVSIPSSYGFGLTGFAASPIVSNGQIVGVSVLSGGTGATSAVSSVLITDALGNAATASATMRFRARTVTIASAGTGFLAAPVVTFMPNPADTRYTPAAATSTINSSGGIASVSVLSGGEYALPPTAIVQSGTAEATVTMTPRMSGVYKCCVRYLDSTPTEDRGPNPSSISELVEVDCGASASSMTWEFSHAGLDDRVAGMELWRTTTGQSVVLFRVATIKRTDPAFFATYQDTLSDEDLKDTERDGYGLMPVTLPSGQVNARRFEVPPGNYGVAVMFQDRAWYAVDTTKEKPNSLLFSEVDEPESVPPSNELVIQESIGDSDAVVALIPLATSLLAVQSRHIYKIQYVAQPVIDASVLLASYRGILNDRCWSVMGGVAFIVDSFGMYAFDGDREEPISAPIDDLWRDRIIDFSKSHLFHVKADTATRTARFFFCRASDSDTVRAMCYCVATKAWWEEEYPTAVTASANMEVLGRQDVVYGTSAGGFVRAAGYTDQNNAAVAYRLRTGCLPLANVDKGSRSLGVLYTATAGDAELRASLHYNNSSSPRPNAIASDRGDGFVTTSGSTYAALNMKMSRSSLGDATGVARAYYAGSVDERSAGSDRHIAIALSGEQSSAQNAVKLHAVTVDGVGNG